MMKTFILLLSFILSASVSFSAFSQQSYQLDGQEQSEVSDAELAQMLAPIALYPDSLLTHILISSTYPIEVIKAQRWLENNADLNAAQIAQAIESFDWDASVKALVPFEQILTHLSEDLTWMQLLGDTFLEDEARVLEGIQTLREKAKIAGNLSKMNNMEISYEDSNIIIEPVKKEVVYVPYYDTRMVYGTWHWASYPPVYWRPSLHVSVNRHNPFYWHSGVHISFNYFFSTFQWKKRHVLVVNPHKSHHYRKPSVISRGGYAKRWVHQPIHRKGVAYRSMATGQKYYSKKVRLHNKRKSTQHLESQLKQKKVVQHKVNASHKNIQKVTAKQRQTRNYQERSTKKSVKQYNHSVKSRPQHNTSSKTYRSRDSKANN
ncbi:DUF3300 domain-containing protein [Colwellia sp. 6_MG-2023]|uniref:DUF3300 domain-containing protein n=1 Tax=Colwellia sp. 6_MG-2023 TaxID=3062676 RepID=UPI0026E22636|nr:DUF3300 domain-containing protein [Colwellia sp. 6_MG-2023]MDO6489347.1 DUF3300 domain-containing protein [Colwellia sp. 6_MG-2023]